jgi:hypothetical protein
VLDIFKKLDRWERDLDRLFPDAELSKRDQLAIAAQVKPKSWPEFARGTLIRSGKAMIPFEPYPFQTRIIELLDIHKKGVCAKVRQLGLTECKTSRMLQKAHENPPFAGVIFSRTQDDSSNIARRSSLMAATSNIALNADNSERIETENGAQLMYKPATDDAGRGLESIWDILYDEAAFVKNIAKIYGAASPSQNMLGADAETFLISTPNGKSGFFWQMLQDNNPDGVDILQICEGVREGTLYKDGIPGFYWFVDKTGWIKFFVHWRAHPVYSKIPNYLEYVRDRDNLDDATLQREHNLVFEDSSSQVFDTALVDAALCGRALPAYPGRRYIMAIDTSQGGDDFYMCGVIDITEAIAKEVAQFRAHRGTSDYYLQKTIELYDQYRPVTTVFETNAGGQLYMDQMILKRPAASIEGVYTNSRSKPVMVGHVKLLLERQMIWFIPSDVTRDEFRNYQRFENGSYAGADGQHDDTVSMWLIASTKIDLNRKRTQLPPRQRKPNIPTANDIFG